MLVVEAIYTYWTLKPNNFTATTMTWQVQVESNHRAIRVNSLVTHLG
jgi:hypothetical protein